MVTDIQIQSIFVCWVCNMISYKMYEKNLISSINVNVMHHFQKQWNFIYFIENLRFPVS